MSIQFAKINAGAQIPRRQTDGAAGFDVHAHGDYVIAPFGRKLIGTGIAMALPKGTVGVIKPRSSWAVNGITTDAGVIDEDYRGEVKVLLKSGLDEPFRVNHGDRIAQLIVVPYLPESVEVDELDETIRGYGGFGSTG